MPPADTPLDTDRLIEQARAQGWRAERRRGLIVFRGPGASVLVTMRDEPGGLANGVSRLCRGGFVPEDPILLPPHTVEVDTHPGQASSEEELLRVEARLDGAPEAILPALSLDTATGAIGATFQVAGDDVDEAAQNAAVALVHALLLAGLDVPHQLGSVRVVGAALVSAVECAGAPAEPGHRATG